MEDKSAQQLLLGSLKEKNEEVTRAHVSRLSEQDWEEITRLAEEFGVGPIWFSILRKAQIRIPSKIEKRLEQSLLDNTARNLHLLVTFAEISKALRQAGIQVMPLKGIYLASEIYDQPGLRTMSDLDILVRQGDLDRSVRVIESLGYRPERPYSIDSEDRMFHHLPNYLRPGSPPLEIHFRLLMPMPQFHCDMEAVWLRAQAATILSEQLLTLSPEDLLLYLCAHTAYHHLYVGALRSLYDLHLLLWKYRDSLNWVSVADRAREWGVTNSLYLTLRLQEELIGSTVSDQAWQLLQPAGFDERLIGAAREKFFSRQELSRTIAMVWENKSLPQRLGGVLRRIFLPPSVLAQKYDLQPAGLLVYLYYLVRIKDLMVNYSRDVWGLVIGKKEVLTRADPDMLLIHWLGWVETR